MTLLRLKNFQLLDPDNDELRGGHEILIEGEKIREVSDRSISSQGAVAVDCGGRTVMPGLIDCHVHVFLSEVVIRRLEDMPLTAHDDAGGRPDAQLLDRGFTSARDTGGADWGIKAAVDQGLLAGPRLFIAGKGDWADRRSQRRAAAHGRSSGTSTWQGCEHLLQSGQDSKREADQFGRA
jgi:imidazolonepropionase-like amidohydrolase